MKDIQQLIKRDNQEGKYKDIFPQTYIEAISDRQTGVGLDQILNSFNMYFLNYLGGASITRLQVIDKLRRQGLWITYVTFDNKVIIEWYNSTDLSNTAWANSSNWMQGNNMLVGDITISSNGTWVINGEDTGIPARGEQGITPILRVSEDNRLEVSYNEGNTWNGFRDIPVFIRYRVHNNKLQESVDFGKTWEDVSDYIGAWFRWNKTSEIDGTLQISRDEKKTWEDISPVIATDIITNSEDIVKNDSKELEFANKEYNPEQFSGLGRVYLRKNIVDGKNILTQEMINKPNTRYIIQYDYDLNQEEITIPENCTLDFQGGKVTKGTIYGNKSKLVGYISIKLQDNIILDGSYINLKLSWFDIDYTGLYDSTELLKMYLKLNPKNLILPNKSKILLSEQITISNQTYINGNGSKLIFKNSSEYTNFNINLVTDNLEISNLIIDIEEGSSNENHTLIVEGENCYLKNIEVINSCNNAFEIRAHNTTLDKCRAINPKYAGFRTKDILSSENRENPHLGIFTLKNSEAINYGAKGYVNNGSAGIINIDTFTAIPNDDNTSNNSYFAGEAILGEGGDNAYTYFINLRNIYAKGLFKGGNGIKIRGFKNIILDNSYIECIDPGVASFRLQPGRNKEGFTHEYVKISNSTLIGFFNANDTEDTPSKKEILIIENCILGNSEFATQYSLDISKQYFYIKDTKIYNKNQTNSTAIINRMPNAQEIIIDNVYAETKWLFNFEGAASFDKVGVVQTNNITGTSLLGTNSYWNQFIQNNISTTNRYFVKYRDFEYDSSKVMYKMTIGNGWQVGDIIRDLESNVDYVCKIPGNKEEARFQQEINYQVPRIFDSSSDSRPSAYSNDGGIITYDRDTDDLILWNGRTWVNISYTKINELEERIEQLWKNYRGLTTERPTLRIDDDGYPFYDRELKKYILWDGTDWTNFDGTPLS